jgi:hypothetical protein
MFGSGKKKKKPSLLKRLVYLVVLLSSGGGVGGWALQDHPQVKALLNILSDAEANGIDSIDVKSVEGKVASAVAGVIQQKVGGDFSRPGVYQVVIPKVSLNPAGFKPGHTVDIQAKVIKLDPRGRDMTLWESKPFGERLAVVGKEQLTTGWPVRMFQVPWNPGDQLVVEVYDNRGGLFVQPRRFALAPAGPGARDFPLKSGTFDLVPIRAANSEQVARGSQIEFRSQRIGDLDQNNSTQVAERPIVIR